MKETVTHPNCDVIIGGLLSSGIMAAMIGVTIFTLPWHGALLLIPALLVAAAAGAFYYHRRHPDDHARMLLTSFLSLSLPVGLLLWGGLYGLAGIILLAVPAIALVSIGALVGYKLAGG